MAVRLPALTARQKAHVRKVANDLFDGYYSGEDDSTSEDTVYGTVEIFPDDEAYAYLVRHGIPTRVPMTAGRHRVGAKRKAGRKTATRKKVPAKKVANPGRRAKPRRKANGQFAKVARAKRVKARRRSR